MTTCPSAPRQARGLRGATLRRLAGNKCPRIYQTHDMQPSRCDARPLAARWQGEGMTKIEVKATPDWLAEQVVTADGSGNTLLVDSEGGLVARTGQTAGIVRAWLVEQIEAGYHAGVEAGRAEGQESIAGRVAAARGDALAAHTNELRAALGVTDPWDGCLATVRDLVTKDKSRPAPTDAAAESAAIDGLVSEAIRGKGVQLNAHDRTGRWRLSLGDTSIVDQREIAGAWLKGWLLAAWARGVAYGQVDISTGESRCAVQLANALGHVGETLPTWEEALALVIPDQSPPSPGDFFGMAAREQVAAERAVELSEEDSIRATFAKSEIEGLRNEAEDLANEVKNLRRSRDSAVAAHDEDKQHAATLREMLGAPADEPWSGILRRARALRNDYVEVAAMATVLRQDIPGRVAAAVAPSEEAIAAAREEGRRAGIEEATTSLNEYLGARLARLANATKSAEEARKAAAQRNAEVAQLTVETETLREALDVLFDTKETP